MKLTKDTILVKMKVSNSNSCGQMCKINNEVNVRQQVYRNELKISCFRIRIIFNCADNVKLLVFFVICATKNYRLIIQNTAQNTSIFSILAIQNIILYNIVLN